MDAGSFLLQATEIGLAASNRAVDVERAVFARLLASRSYSRAELMLAMREVPFDPDRFGGRGVTVQDVERVVLRHRRLRAKLRQPMTAAEITEVCVAFPRDVSTDGFRCCGFDAHNQPLFRYAPEAPAATSEPTPVIEDPDPPRRREGVGPAQLGDVLPEMTPRGG